MKKLIALLLAVIMLLSMTACGGAAEPVDTAPATTEAPTTAPTEAPTEEPTVAPTEAPTEPVISAEELLQSDDTVTLTGKTPAEYWQILLDLGYIELWAFEAREIPSYPKDYELISLTYNDKAFRLDFTAIDYWGSGQHYEGFSLYGTKANGPADITGINLEAYTEDIWEGGPVDTGIPENVKNFLTEMNVTIPIIKKVTTYTAIDPALADSEEYIMNSMPQIYHASFYYPATGKLYNFVRESQGILNTWFNTPSNILNTEWQLLLKHSFEKEIIPYGDFTVELNQFAVQYGGQLAIYQYRPGMSLIGWACSELNTDGWIPWYDNSVLSPDRKYMVRFADHEISEISQGFCIEAAEFDGSPDWYWNVGFILSNGKELPNITAATQAERRKNLETWLADIGGTEEEEKNGGGLIPFQLAYTVNAYTPLITEGFRTMSTLDGRTWYHMMDLNAVYLLDDTIDVYMNNISDEVLPHVKLYVFPEPQGMLDALGGKNIMDVDLQALHLNADWMEIPENAVCLTFNRCPDGQDAPDSPFPYAPAHGENRNKNAVYARYKVAEDPNVDPSVGFQNPHFVDLPMAMAITYDDEIVYWIHLGTRTFHKDPSSFHRYVNAGRY